MSFVLSLEQAHDVYAYVFINGGDSKSALRLYNLFQYHYPDLGDGGIIHLSDWLVDLAYDIGKKYLWPEFLPPHREMWQSSQVDYK